MLKDFDKFMSQLKETNATLDFYTDFNKIRRNVQNIEISLNMLNFLLGKDDLYSAVKALWDRDPKVFNVLDILIATRREGKKKFIDVDGEIKLIKTLFSSVDGIMKFFNETGLADFFKKNSCRLKEDGCIHFIKNIIRPIKTKIGDNKLCQVRIIPQATCYVVEVIYEKKEQDLNLDKDNFLSIDLGLNNLCTCISNVGIKPFIVNGKIIKSFNQWYNKKRARLMSYIGDKGTSKRLRRLNNYRNFWIEDKIHKVSRFIVNICIENNIGNLVVGLNKGWKNGVNLGKRINQKFVEIPFSKLVEKISYKCKLVGIDFQVHEESYTSKVDHLAFEKLGKHDVYLGKRKKRGLFQSSIGKLINADINGAIGIGRKVFGDSYVSKIIDSGLAFNPVRVNIL